MKITDTIYFNEVLTPKQDSEDIEKDLEKFAAKYTASVENEFVICITDNPLGNLSFEALDTIETCELPVEPDKILIHLNTFHRKQDLDRMLKGMIEHGISNLLVVSGDGNTRLHRLLPEELGLDTITVTSIELIKYIHTEYPDTFTCGVAFNHYEPQDAEREKLEAKFDAGAEFIITQPVIEQHENIDWLKTLNVPVVVEAWMSRRIDLVAECVGYPLPKEKAEAYDAVENFSLLRKNYPEFGVYFAFLGMKKQILLLREHM